MAARSALAAADLKVRSRGFQHQSHFGNKPDESAMTASPVPVQVAILTFPETTASVTYGMYDLLVGAGRDWGFVVTGQPGPSLMHPTIVSVQRQPFAVANGISITPQAG